MKKMLLTSLLVIGVVLAATAVYAVDQTLTSTVNATVGSSFSLAFYNDPFVLYNSNVPFSSVNPASQYNYADGRFEGDGKSDIGLLVTTNQGTTWYLKIGLNALSPLLGKLGYFMGQPTNRNTGGPADGTLGFTNWTNLPSQAAPLTMYTAGINDKTNTPLGTLATLSYKINGSGMAPGTVSGTVTYTLTAIL